MKCETILLPGDGNPILTRRSVFFSLYLPLLSQSTITQRATHPTPLTPTHSFFSVRD